MSEQNGTGLEQGGPASASPSGRTKAKAEYHHYGGVLPFVLYGAFGAIAAYVRTWLVRTYAGKRESSGI